MPENKDHPSGFEIQIDRGKGKKPITVQAQGRIPLVPGDRSVELVASGKPLPLLKKLKAEQIAFGEPPTPEESRRREQYERIKRRKSHQSGTKR